jgi:hypothetical protein
MSRFIKIFILLIALGGIVYLFVCSVNNRPEKQINEQELTQYILDEYNYEIVFGNENVDVSEFIDQTLILKLKENN